MVLPTLLLLLPVVALLALGSLTTVPSPHWSRWKLAVLAGEYGHWLALGAVALALTGAGLGGPAGWTGSGLGLVAGGLLLKPAWQAARIAASLPRRLAADLGPAAPAEPPFAWTNLVGSEPVPVPVVSREFAPGLALDLYEPAGASGPAPVVLMIHGGGWDSGDRTQLAFLNHWIARRGYAVAAISYRLAPSYRWPAQRDDVLAALTWIKAHGAQHRIDATRIVLAGRSAGGQIAQVVAYTAGDPAIRGVIGLYAPSDLHFGYAHAREDDVLRSPQLMRQFLGGTPETARAAYDSASAYLHVGRGCPPTLLLHGENDTLVWYRHSVRLAERLAEHGVPRALVSLPWATHAFEYNLRGPGGQLARFALEWFLQVVTRHGRR